MAFGRRLKRELSFCFVTTVIEETNGCGHDGQTIVRQNHTGSASSSVRKFLQAVFLLAMKKKKKESR